MESLESKKKKEKRSKLRNFDTANSHLPFAMSHRGDSGMKPKQHRTVRGGTADIRARRRQLCPNERTAHAAKPTNKEPMAHITWTSTRTLCCRCTTRNSHVTQYRRRIMAIFLYSSDWCCLLLLSSYLIAVNRCRVYYPVIGWSPAVVIVVVDLLSVILGACIFPLLAYRTVCILPQEDFPSRLLCMQLKRSRQAKKNVSNVMNDGSTVKTHAHTTAACMRVDRLFPLCVQPG